MNNDQYFDDFFDNDEQEKLIPKSDISILKNYSEELTAKEYVTNPAIAREEEIKKMILILLSPEKSVVLTGKAGIGKTALVEGLSYKIQNHDVPNALANCKIYRINTSALLGTYEHDGVEEAKLQLLIDEIKGKKDIILFIDEVHTLVTSARNGGGVDFLNMLKPGLDRGDIKIIGATTTQEFNEYLLKDKAFLRRFEKVEIEEPDAETTVKILMGTRKKIEVSTGVKINYSDWIVEQICRFIVNMTSEYKRVYENGSRYPDVSLSLFSKCFTFAKFENSDVVTFKHIYEAIKNTNLVYDDVIRKELPVFKEKFSEFLEKENVNVEI
jgi:ATP-dependent Clp protease ATP-binding subunit ClpA